MNLCDKLGAVIVNGADDRLMDSRQAAPDLRRRLPGAVDRHGNPEATDPEARAANSEPARYRRRPGQGPEFLWVVMMPPFGVME